jgi:thiol-disulfide isomerase/thioredoxin
MILRFLTSLVVIAAVSVLAVFAASAQTPQSGTPAAAGSTGPDIPGGSVKTDSVRVIDLEGLQKILQRYPKDTRPLLINFWATWCDGCREEFPDLVKIDNDYRGKVNFVSVTLDEITEINTAVPEFLKKMKAQMTVVLLNVKDPEPAIHAVDATWDGALPATYLYDKDGKVVFKYFGAIKPAELRKAIDTQLGNKQ